MRALRHVFGAGPATRCGGGNSETAVLPALVLVVFARGGPSRDEDGGMFGATHIALIAIGRSRHPALVTGLEVDVPWQFHPPLAAEFAVPTRRNGVRSE